MGDRNADLRKIRPEGAFAGGEEFGPGGGPDDPVADRHRGREAHLEAHARRQRPGAPHGDEAGIPKDRSRLQRLDHRHQRGHLFLALRHRQQQVRDHVHANLELGARGSLLGDLAREIAVDESRKGLLDVPERPRSIRDERIGRAHVHVPGRGDEIRTNPVAMTIVGVHMWVSEPAAKPGMGHTLGDPLKKRFPLFIREQLRKPAVEHVFVNHGLAQVVVRGSPSSGTGRKEHDSVTASP